jgi:hypothetical protein
MAEVRGTEDGRKGRLDAHSEAERTGALTRQRQEPSTGLLKARERRETEGKVLLITQ